MRYTRQSLLRMAHEMNQDWGIFDLIYYWQTCGNADMYQLFYNMSKRDVLWFIDKCFQEFNEKQYDDKILIRVYRYAYTVLAERLEKRKGQTS